MYLEDKAAEDFRELERESHWSNWESFKSAFGQKCGTSAVRYQDVVTELKRRDMRAGESISSSYAAIVKIVDRYFKGQPSAQRAALISAFFSAGFNNKSLADYVARDANSHTLEGALAAARQWETFNGQRFGEDWDRAKVNTVVTKEEESDFEKALKELMKLNMEQKVEADKNKAPLFDSQPQMTSITCYYCHGPGHISRNCPVRLNKMGGYMDWNAGGRPGQYKPWPF
jgi:hypothetical protein